MTKAITREEIAAKLQPHLLNICLASLAPGKEQVKTCLNMLIDEVVRIVRAAEKD